MINENFINMINHKLKWGIMPLMAAALLAAGCTKEVETPGLRIIEKNMTGRASNSKVAVDFTDLTHNTWVAGGANSSESGKYYKEYICVAQGSSSPVTKEILESDGNFYIEFNPTDDFSAGYPSAANQSSSTSVSIPYSLSNNALRYYFSANSTRKCNVQFPMAAFGHSGDQSVTFYHATGAIAFDIVNNTDITRIKSIVITALDENNAAVGLWGGNLTCTPNGNGISVANSGTSNTTKFYPNTAYTETSSLNYCYYSTSNGGRIPVVLPIPSTPKATKFQIAIYQANYVHSKIGWYYAQGDLIIQRTTPLMDIGLNEIHKLGDFYLAD